LYLATVIPIADTEVSVMQAQFIHTHNTSHNRFQTGKTAVSIRRATATIADAVTIADMGTRLLPAAHRGALPAADMNQYLYKSFQLAAVRAELKKPTTHFWLAEHGQATVGMLKMNPAQPPIAGLGKRPVELSRLYLEKDWIGKGVGSALMEYGQTWAAQGKHDICWLMVWTGNQKALAFYRRWGFEVAGTMNYQVGQSTLPAYVMISNLENV
jgi:GNAT superfamily N-acetyltransferase